MCTCFVHAISVICRFVPRRVWTLVKVWIVQVFTEFDFSLGDLMIRWDSYVGSSVTVFIMNIKYMT